MARAEKAETERDEARADAKRMDLARNQFVGERNALVAALPGIQRGDMANMMELTEAEAAQARAGWALKRIGQPIPEQPKGGERSREREPVCRSSS